MQQIKISIARVTYDRLSALKASLQAERGRQVTVTETIAELLARWEATEAKEAAR